MLRLLKFKPFRKLKIVQRLLERKRAKKLRSESTAGDLVEEKVCTVVAEASGSGHGNRESCDSDYGRKSPSAHLVAHDGSAAKSSGESVEQASVLGCCQPLDSKVPVVIEALESAAVIGDGSQAVATEVPFHVRAREENATARPPPNPFGGTACEKQQELDDRRCTGSRKPSLQRKRGVAGDDHSQQPCTHQKDAERAGDAPREAGRSAPCQGSVAAAAAGEASAAAAVGTKSALAPPTSNFMRSDRHRHSMPEARTAGAMSRLHRLRRSFSRASSGRARYGELVSRPSDCSLGPDELSRSIGDKEETEPRVTAQQVAKVLRRSFRKSGKYLKDGAQLLSATGLASGLGWVMAPSYAMPLPFGGISTTV